MTSTLITESEMGVEFEGSTVCSAAPAKVSAKQKAAAAWAAAKEKKAAGKVEAASREAEEAAEAAKLKGMTIKQREKYLRNKDPMFRKQREAELGYFAMMCPGRAF